MKLIFIFPLITTLFLQCAKSNLSLPDNSPPVYVDDYSLAPNICEFAADGERQILIDEIKPYIKNGRVYFFCFAFPFEKGYLKAGSQFTLEMEKEFLLRQRIFAVYQGPPGGALTSKPFYPAAGYAERGSIIITHVFFDWDEARKWYDSVQVASKVKLESEL